MGYGKRISLNEYKFLSFWGMIAIRRCAIVNLEISGCTNRKTAIVAVQCFFLPNSIFYEPKHLGLVSKCGYGENWTSFWIPGKAARSSRSY